LTVEWQFSHEVIDHDCCVVDLSLEITYFVNGKWAKVGREWGFGHEMIDLCH
jgi:hypothetical protein